MASSVRSAALPGRRHVFAATIFVVIANAVTTKASYSVTQLGWGAALTDGLGLGWAFWLSVGLCMRLALISDDRSARARDGWLCAAALVAAMVPLAPVSAVAGTLIGLVFMLDRGQDARLRAAAMILLAISVQLFWARLFMLFLLGPVATLDAHMISLIIQTPVQGNMVGFADGRYRMSILEACTSVQNISMALLLFVAIIRTFRPAPVVSEIYYAAAACLSVIVINIVRLSLMAQNIEMFHLIHGDVGSVVVNTIITVSGLFWAGVSVRREILD